ncbi:MAG: hypothetical protein OCD01_11170 [Fibrobacterales bacterium]
MFQFRTVKILLWLSFLGFIACTNDQPIDDDITFASSDQYLSSEFNSSQDRGVSSSTKHLTISLSSLSSFNQTLSSDSPVSPTPSSQSFSSNGHSSTSLVNSSSSKATYPVVDPSKDKLANIIKKCESPITKLTDGQPGWNSRYWDCCKPHCSVPQNTDNLTKNCSIDDIETPCFKEVGNEFWTGIETIKTGCAEGGETFACYSHAPFAVCEDLAYGFAAVPGIHDDMCGSCFQLDYDGGFQHGEPKEAHTLMKGKSMIVMASNIGHDVAGGQFDIMIPGGGLGAFDAGCAVQWNVDPNDEQLVGKKFGGFMTTCREALGNEEPADTYKDCVRNMCDNLFGFDPKMKDLWEGCIWYVDWMHAVDNPTFTYKQVECPQVLLDMYGSEFHEDYTMDDLYN